MVNFSDQTRTGAFMAVWPVTISVAQYVVFLLNLRDIFLKKIITPGLYLGVDWKNECLLNYNGSVLDTGQNWVLTVLLYF